MTSPDFIESVARAIYKALSVQGQSISIYKFEAGDTWIDGEFDLSLVASAAIEAVLRAVLEDASTNAIQMTYDDALDFVRDFIKARAIDLKEKDISNA